MLFRNTKNNYGWIAILLHWLMAIIMIALLAMGLYMVRLPISLAKLKLYGWHKEYGILILALVLVRVAWRLSNYMPLLPSTMPKWEKLAARSAHLAFYLFMFALPLSGWMISSAAGLPVSFFGLFVLPDLISPDESIRLVLQQLHEWLGYGLIALIILHVSAALQHHFYNRDDILRRMLWP